MLIVTAQRSCHWNKLLCSKDFPGLSYKKAGFVGKGFPVEIF